MHSGVYSGADGAARVYLPRSGLTDLIRASFNPLRRATCGNGLVQQEMLRALNRLRPHLSASAAGEATRQIELIVREVEASDMLEEDREAIRALAENRIGAPPPAG